MNFVLAVLLLIVGVANAAQPTPLNLDSCQDALPFGVPTVKKRNVTPICREGYFTIHDNQAKIPIVAAYVLHPRHAAGACFERDSSFESDRSLPVSARATTADYARSGYDIGHMVSAEDLKYSSEAQATAAILSNAAPQEPGFNRGVWKKLEDTTRGWAISRKHPLLVYVGPVYDRTQDRAIGDGLVTVPRGFYKIVVDLKTEQAQVFLFNHEPSKQPLSTFITNLAEVQRVTDVQFPMPPNPKFGTWTITMRSNQKAKTNACKMN